MTGTIGNVGEYLLANQGLFWHNIKRFNREISAKDDVFQEAMVYALEALTEDSTPEEATSAISRGVVYAARNERVDSSFKLSGVSSSTVLRAWSAVQEANQDLRKAEDIAVSKGHISRETFRAITDRGKLVDATFTSNPLDAAASGPSKPSTDPEKLKSALAALTEDQRYAVTHYYGYGVDQMTARQIEAAKGWYRQKCDRVVKTAKAKLADLLDL